MKITTILGAKGLTSDYVFLVNFDDKYILKKDKITNESIQNFLVSLTRAKRQLHIYASQTGLPIFLRWIDNGNIDVL
ncbi:MAG: 3'-5' exonuclease [Candidatus Ratteibacteria bacterium]